MSDVWLLACLILLAAVLYSSVGHAGASGYLAAMALFGLAPEQMRPAAFVLNIIVATIGTVQFYRAGYFSWRLFLPFAIGSIPCARLGSELTLPEGVYRPVIGVILFLSAVRFLMEKKATGPEVTRPVSIPLAMTCGAGIGLLAGLTGTGGGIFLSPLILLMRWAGTKQTSAVTVAFILANSITGLSGLLSRGVTLPDGITLWAVAATLGGLVGSEFGSKYLGNRTLRRLLGLVLIIAGLKMILT